MSCSAAVHCLNCYSTIDNKVHHMKELIYFVDRNKRQHDPYVITINNTMNVIKTMLHKLLSTEACRIRDMLKLSKF